MSRPIPVRIIHFDRHSTGTRASCLIRVYADGTAYVVGDELEAVFEGSTDAWKKAVNYVEVRGYIKRPEK